MKAAVLTGYDKKGEKLGELTAGHDSKATPHDTPAKSSGKNRL